MKYAEAKRLVEESELEDDEKEAYALWTSFEDQHQIYDDADPIRHTDDGVRGLEIRGDHEITSPQILPVDVRDFDSEVLHDPPIALVEQLIDPTMKRIDKPTRELAIIRDRTFYEVEEVRYEFHLDRVEESMQLTQLREAVSQAEEGRWTMELSDANVLVFTRQPEPGTEYTDQKLRFEIDSTGQDMSISESLRHLEVNRQLADYALQTIDGEQRREITEIVHRLADEEPEAEAPMMVEDEAELKDDVAFEMEEDEVVVGEQIVVLGGLYMAKSLDG